MELLKLLSTSEMFAQLVSFLLLFFLLRAFAWKRLLKLLDERRARIADEFKRIEDNSREVARLKESYEKQVAGIDDLARQKISQAVEEGRKAQDEIRREAHLESQKIIDKARQDIKYELVQAKQELKEQMVSISLAAAESVIQEKLTEEDDKKIVQDFIDRMDQVEGQG